MAPLTTEQQQQAKIDALEAQIATLVKAVEVLSGTQQTLLAEKRTTGLTVKWDDRKIAMVNTNVLTKDSLSKEWHKPILKRMGNKLYAQRTTEKATQFVQTLQGALSQHNVLTKDSLSKEWHKPILKRMGNKLYAHRTTEKATQFVHTLQRALSQQDEKLVLLMFGDVRIDVTKERESDLNALHARMYHSSLELMTFETQNLFVMKINESSTTLMADLVNLIQQRASQDYATGLSSLQQFHDLQIRDKTVQWFVTKLDTLSKIIEQSHSRLARNDTELTFKLIYACGLEARFESAVSTLQINLPTWEKELEVTYDTIEEREANLRTRVISFFERVE
eukprot:CAMPEP_0197430990 /NCGR_PEP_ID=MMETSP1170-20131217/52945_1 /TAXON_ID=54406 /ORGANISM="Sarcinochrysis sp, Strain CCMP770" /LENGTH=335 /DNA_ID=CAMNT_0042958927 /DNA_START=506 /DNA_END=1511 /DNA_ORIENTATION=+